MSKQISYYVKKYIEGDPTIKVGIQRGLISARVLTKHIIEEEREFKGSFDDVRNAVRKYSAESLLQQDFKNVYVAFKGSHIDIKSRLAYIEIDKNIKNDELVKINNFYPKEKFVRFLSNEKSFILIANEEDTDKILKLIGKDNILSVTANITSVTINLDKSVKHIPGVYFLIMGQISLNKINIYDISSFKSELTIYVDKKDAVKVHQLLYDLCEYEKKFCKLKV
jgi:hypothetical protein